MAMRKGATLHILAGYSDMKALLQQGAVSQHFTHAPINGIAFKGHVMARLHQLDHLFEKSFALRKGRYCLCHSLECFQAELGVGRQPYIARPGGRVRQPHLFHEGHNDVFLNALGLIEVTLKHGLELQIHFLHQVSARLTFRNQFGVINRQRIGVFCNGFVKLWLRETRLITFVVSILSVTQQINEHIALPFLSVLNGKTHGMNHCLHIIPIDMENGCKHHLCHVSAVR